MYPTAFAHTVAIAVRDAYKQSRNLEVCADHLNQLCAEARRRRTELCPGVNVELLRLLEQLSIETKMAA